VTKIDESTCKISFRVLISELNSVNIGLMLKDLFNGFIVTYMLELYDFVMDEVDYNRSERD